MDHHLRPPLSVVVVVVASVDMFLRNTKLEEKRITPGTETTTTIWYYTIHN